jgi:hypothetical protein
MREDPFLVLAVPGEVPISRQYLLEQGSCSRATETYNDLVGQRSKSNRNRLLLGLHAVLRDDDGLEVVTPASCPSIVMPCTFGSNISLLTTQIT